SYWPVESVAIVRTIPVDGLAIVTVTRATMAPVGSVTVPRIPVSSVCAWSRPAAKAIVARTFVSIAPPLIEHSISSLVGQDLPDTPGNDHLFSLFEVVWEDPEPGPSRTEFGHVSCLDRRFSRTQQRYHPLERDAEFRLVPLHRQPRRMAVVKIRDELRFHR